ncbi:NAD(P)/FAD-dependent oxidoreductase [Solitalea sp. MAHUQ-68]|uniref:NADH:ubiquinone reductase (non-electrogenic) n=1 Tax=Solitalea agri TaxID=2953739 RepID=A0A9X2EZS1_9SPHI|nr:NAD(P)/FAD-dependent oxidoreductase [Solitalea agri]MCO4291440.1 NAD(P)/FAD-dependent oxidoreductase [Solitalea agri]
MSVDIPETNFPRVVIIGGGFGGIQAAKKLNSKEVQVIMIDRHNYHTFQPLLYQVATGGLEPDSIAHPLRKIFKNQKNFIFRVAEAQEVIADKKVLVTNIGEIHYDYLVIATGSSSNYFGMKDLEKHTMPMKTIPEALDMRSLVLQNLESALLTDSINEQEAYMNFVVVGGGPTGVETAGALAELKNHVLPHDYPELDIRRMQINLIEGGDRLLGAMSVQASEKSADFLKSMGVNVRLNERVLSFDGERVQLGSGKGLETKVVIWSAGVKGVTLPGINKEVIVGGNRFKVNVFNQIEGYDNIFAIGDVAAMITDEFPKGHPGVAPAAIQQGRLFAKNIIKKINDIPMEPFKYFDKGSMATVGRNRAVVDMGFIRFQGTFAWFVWMFVHLMTLVGFRNRVVVFVNWVWSYFSYDRGTRLIIRRFEKENDKKLEQVEA